MFSINGLNRLEEKLMDTLKRLKFETNAIIGLIRDYSYNPVVKNITDQFQSSLELNDIESIRYSLEQLENWYSLNRKAILENEFVHNKSDHLQAEHKIKEFLKELPLEIVGEESSITRPSGSQIKELEKKIFISHSSKDKTLCDAFVELLENIGVPSENIIYTSSPYHGIPGDEDIFEYLKKHLFEGVYVIYMLSDNYYNSVYCLNEMGATWVNSNKSSTLILPGFNGDIKGVIDKNKKAYSLKEPIELIELKDKILRMYDLTLDGKKWERVRTKFYETLK